MWVENLEVKQILWGRNAQLHVLILLLLKLLPALLTATAISLPVHIDTQMSRFMWAIPYPWVLWSYELLFR